MPGRANFQAAVVLMFWCVVHALTAGACAAPLNKELNAGPKDAKIRERIEELRGTVAGGSPAEFATIISEATGKWAKVIEFAGIKVE